MLDVIRNRRSIRMYTGEPVPMEALESILRSAMQAPTARNLQPWEFVVVTDRDSLRRIPDHHPYSSMVPDAAAAVLVCGNTELQKDPGYLSQDCSAAVQNMLLQAVAEGLGTVWLGVYPNPDRMEGMSRLFGLPEHVLPMALISIGVPGEEIVFDDRFDPAKVHIETW